MSKGSTWNIWDFHLHTPCSVLNNQFGDPEKPETWETYVTQIESVAKAKGIAAIGVTDYFTIEGYKRLLEIQRNGRLQNILLFPNIEFRIETIVYKSKGNADPKRLNLHVLFSPEVSPDQIEENFLHDLEFVYENDPFEEAKFDKLKIKNIEDFGKRLQAQEAKFAGQSPFRVGCIAAVVPQEKIKKELGKGKFKGKYLIVLAEENTDVMNWGNQHHAVRQQLIQMSHALFSSNPNTRDFCLGKNHASFQAYLEEFKSLKPCIWGCDAHGYAERFLEPDEGRYCWVKAEVTWEGLKQILYEPEERVRIQQHSPEPKKSIYTIEKLAINGTEVNSALSVSPIQINLNPNLVAIIGGRGSGKTALLDLISVCFKEGTKLARTKSSFYHRLYVGDDPKRHPHSEPIPIALSFRSTEVFSKCIGQDDTFFEKADVIYLTQNHFEEYSEDPTKLNRHIIDLVFENYPDDRRIYEQHWESIHRLESDIETLNLQIRQFRENIEGQKESEELARKVKDGDRVDYLQRITDAEAQQGQSDQAIVKLTKRLDELKATKRTIGSLLYDLSAALDELYDFEIQYTNKVTDINKDLKSLTGLSLELLPGTLVGIGDVRAIITNNTSALKSANVETEKDVLDVTANLDKLEGTNRTIAEWRQKIDEITYEIESIDKRINEITDTEQMIRNLDHQRFQSYAHMLQGIMQIRDFLNGMMHKFESGKDKMLSRLEFSAKIDERSAEYITRLASKTDNRSFGEAYLWSQFSDILAEMLGIMDGDAVSADFSTVIEAVRKFGSGLGRKQRVTESEFYDVLLSRFFNIGLEVKFNGRTLGELSMGQRAVVLLKMLLSLDDKPLLIDQPEEHLDNRYIYEELMPAFREAKTKRQIIIATHNANLVVNTDAEQIVIAEHKDGTSGALVYRVGTLEDLSTREEIKTILEGGSEAFMKREAKYGFNF